MFHFVFPLCPFYVPVTLHLHSVYVPSSNHHTQLMFRLRSVFVAFTFRVCSSYVPTMAQHTFRLLDTFHWLGVDRIILDIIGMTKFKIAKYR